MPPANIFSRKKFTPSGEKPLVLIVEPNATHGAELVNHLQLQFHVHLVSSGPAAQEYLRQQNTDLVLLALEAPGTQAFAFCESLRGSALTRKIPLIALAERDSLELKLGAFQRGADDFLARPFAHEELKARIASRLRDWRPNLRLETGKLVIDRDLPSIEVNGKPTSCTQLEIELLSFFVSNQGRTISREEFLDILWNEDAVKPRTIDTHIVSLRKKLRGSGMEISSIYGAGYVLRPKSHASR